MKRKFVRFSFLLTVAAVVMFSSAISAFAAANEKRYDVKNNDGLFITITNVVDEKGMELYGYRPIPVFVVNKSTTVKFEGDVWGIQNVRYSVDGKLSDGSTDGEFTFIKLEDQKYIVNREEYEEFTGEKIDSTEDWVVLDSYDPDYWGEVSYPAGTHVTLTEPGHYLIMLARPAIEEDVIIIQVLAEGETSNDVTVQPTSSKIVVDGEIIAFEAYNINGNNFFKLRDLAAALDGTSKSFEVTWDEDNQSINLLSGQSYTIAGGELTIPDEAVSVKAKPTYTTLYVDDRPLDFIAYNIHGNNFFKLRDIARALDIGVTWDAETGQVGIDTSVSYTE